MEAPPTQLEADELHPGGAERPSEAAMREADQHDAGGRKRDGSRRLPAEARPRKRAATSRKRGSSKTTAASTNGTRVSGRQAVLKVLADGKPRKAGEITAAAVKLIRPKPQGKTPEATLSALLYTQAKKPDGIVTRTRKPGEFKLRPAAKSKAKA